MRPRERRRGVWLAVLGPDGSGKSTVLAAVARQAADSFARTRRFHLRPGIGSWGDGAQVTDPHGRAVRSVAGSWSKLALWWADYWMGYLLWIRPALRGSGLVLFDRYFDDLLVDPVRYRYGASPGLVRWVGRRIPRPDIVIVLDAPVDTLRARKREVSMEESARQRDAYRRLAESLPDAFVVDASRPLPDVVAEVAMLIERRGEEVQKCPV